MLRHPLLLLILDGFGIRTDNTANAVNNAVAPIWHKLWQDSPQILLDASAEAVGLPENQIGNSEVGHLTIGSGRVIYQDLSRIDNAIKNGSFNQNPVLLAGIEKAKALNSTIHLFGLLSPGGVHSHEEHFNAMLALCQAAQFKNVVIHAFLDGRDVPPKSALSSLQKLEAECQRLGVGRIASISGRYFGMDRDQRWERVQEAYDLLTQGKAAFHAPSAEQALLDAYKRNESDEFVQATIIDQGAVIQDKDAIYFMNFRSDRARQLSRAFLQTDFQGFVRKNIPQLSAFVSMTEYAADIPSQVAFPSISPVNTIGEYLAKQGLSQLRIAETEKYAHVTFFFNGGREETFPYEDRVLVPSPKVATYDQQPAMSAIEITDKLLAAIASNKYDFIVCNFANPDMVGHTGDYEATLQAVSVIDDCLAKLIPAVQAVGGEMIITADHGNAECMYDEKNHQPHTAHTTEPVPFVFIGRPVKLIRQSGTLADVAPTLLNIIGLPVPKEMTGHILLEPI